MQTRGGVTLRADVNRPDAPRRLPMLTPFAQPLLDQAYRRLPLMAWSYLLRPVARSLTDDLRHSEDGPTGGPSTACMC